MQSAELLIGIQECYGFAIERGVAGMPAAFMARYGQGRPVIGVLAEYDPPPGWAAPWGLLGSHAPMGLPRGRAVATTSLRRPPLAPCWALGVSRKTKGYQVRSKSAALLPMRRHRESVYGPGWPFQ